MDISALMEKGRFLGLREVERENTRSQRVKTVGYMSYVASRITLVSVIDWKRKYSLRFVLQAFLSFDLTWKIFDGTRRHRLR